MRKQGLILLFTILFLTVLVQISIAQIVNFEEAIPVPSVVRNQYSQNSKFNKGVEFLRSGRIFVPPVNTSSPRHALTNHFPSKEFGSTGNMPIQFNSGQSKVEVKVGLDRAYPFDVVAQIRAYRNATPGTGFINSSTVRLGKGPTPITQLLSVSSAQPDIRSVVIEFEGAGVGQFAVEVIDDLSFTQVGNPSINDWIPPSVSILQPSINGQIAIDPQVELAFTAEDKESGIAKIQVEFLNSTGSILASFYVCGGNMVRSCHYVVDPNKVNYDFMTHLPNHTTTIRVNVWDFAGHKNSDESTIEFKHLINQGPDRDKDGLSDNVERILCTDPNNPDSDSDNLLDGWEVIGHKFKDGHIVNLPAMGAHPCKRDVFVEIDWRLEANKPKPSTELQPVINAYAAHKIGLHIDYGQWGGGEDIGNTKVPIRTHFDPHRIWSFHYVVFNDKSGVYVVREKTSYVSKSRRAETFMHELGHALGLGHGGATGSRAQKRSGSQKQESDWGYQWVWYEQDQLTINNKPNYLSTMNYAWNGQVFVPGSPGSGFVNLYNYSELELPKLDEKNLDERASSAFVQALRAYPLPPGAPSNAVVATMYSCRNPDDGQIYVISTDGHRMLGRLKKPYGPGDWEFKNLPVQDAPGIDWNCNGKIESKVSTNINGKSQGGSIGHPQKVDSTFSPPRAV